MIKFQKDLLRIKVFPTREQMGEAVAAEAAEHISGLLAVKDEINVVFAAAPSQNEVLAALAEKDLPWERVNAYHMDEYVGLSKDSPQSFGFYLDQHIFGLVPFKSVHHIARQDGGLPPERLCEDYNSLLEGIHIDVVFMGVGENGHIAFNDPQSADFSDPLKAKIVELDEVCRTQQVHDGCFPSLETVPTHAITLTVPTLMSADRIFNAVPSEFKAEAIRRMYNEEISPSCPATICRKHPNATLYLDRDSAKYIL